MSRRVLIVDFDSQRLHSTRSLLEGHELEVHTAETLAQLEQALASIDPEVCVVEPDLPGSDGFEICETIRRSSVTARILAASSEVHGEEARSRARRAGVDHFFERPAGDTALVDAVVRSADAAGGTQRSTAPPQRKPEPVAEDGPIELADLEDDAFDGWLDRAFEELEGTSVTPTAPESKPPVKPAATPAVQAVPTPAVKPKPAAKPAVKAAPIPAAKPEPPAKLSTTPEARPLPQKPAPAPKPAPKPAVAAPAPSISSERAQQQVARLTQELRATAAPPSAAIPDIAEPAEAVLPTPPVAARRGNGRWFAIGGAVVVLAGAVAGFVALRGTGSSELPPAEPVAVAQTAPAAAESHDGIFLFEKPSAASGDFGYVTSPEASVTGESAKAPEAADPEPATAKAVATPAASPPKPRPVTTKASAAPVAAATVEQPEPANVTNQPGKTELATDTPTPDPEAIAGATPPAEPAVEDAQPSSLVAETAPAEPIRMAPVNGTFDVVPVLIPSSRVQPRYPMAAARMGIEGVVVLQAMILSDGRVGEIEIVDDPAPKAGLGRAAVKAVRKWRYEPAIRAGSPVDAPLTIQIAFRR